jgi:hypothetical protein
MDSSENLEDKYYEKEVDTDEKKPTVIMILYF